MQVNNTIILEVLQAIHMVKFELRSLKDNNAPKQAQMECFNRLITLYGQLNIEQLKAQIEKQAA